ncbi:MAG: hypothetical protein UZ22_OP11002000434 [Microgenomates bacterium OLB23]|nr:MAG: hypothetical protein UZ22_OP11002000434 [Microgenomates bacterium OLB23]
MFTFNIHLVLICALFGNNMPRKTLKGARAAQQARALRNFLKSQERQINYQGNMQMLFEKLLPYAVAFGVEKKLDTEICKYGHRAGCANLVCWIIVSLCLIIYRFQFCRSCIFLYKHFFIIFIVRFFGRFLWRWWRRWRRWKLVVDMQNTPPNAARFSRYSSSKRNRFTLPTSMFSGTIAYSISHGH